MTEKEDRESKAEGHAFIDRELSWLAFNARVLQEARDPTVPLFERLGFLAIYSSNLDEFFRVRVASLRSLLRLRRQSVEELGFSPRKLLRKINRVVTAQQEEFGRIYQGRILKELEAVGIYLVNDTQVDHAQRTFLRWHFDEHVRPAVEPHLFDSIGDAPFLRDKRLYLICILKQEEEEHFGLVEIPSASLPRFVWVPGPEPRKTVIYLDDVVRANLDTLFPGFTIGPSYAVKLTRDAELYLEDEFEGDLVEKIQRSLMKRESGLPSRFLFDHKMPGYLLEHLRLKLDLDDHDLVEGGRYHNLSDLHSFPRFGLHHLAYAPLPPLDHPSFPEHGSTFDVVAEQDRMLHLPYQKFDHVLQFLGEAATDPDVQTISVTLYRVAPDSAVARALIQAAERGKKVTAFVEVKARFDEAPNLEWAGRLKDAGVEVRYSLPGIKVHAKLALVERMEDGALRRYAYLSTGNFNEDTARVYADSGLFTAHTGITEEVARLFAHLRGTDVDLQFEHLVVAPFALRDTLNQWIDAEIEHANAGRQAHIVVKINSLEDERIIKRLYRADRAGVQVDLIVRGLCRLVPGIRKQSENIRVRSIVDRFLEHARFYYFLNGGDERFYASSADWMKRNLNARIEAAFPLYDPEVRNEVRQMLNLQLADDTKARIIDSLQQNAYYRTPDSPSIRAQTDFYERLKERSTADVARSPVA